MHFGHAYMTYPITNVKYTAYMKYSPPQKLKRQIDIAEDLGQKSWSVSQTRLLIAHFQQNPILWDKRLKDSANKQKTKKAMAPLIA